MKLDLKHVLLYAILPALIAGLFAVAPKFYEIIFETKASLEYELSTGPQITAEGTVQQVISVKVSNSGKKPLTTISAELSVPGATLVASSVENGSGLAIEQKKTDGKVLVQLPRALPGETFSISVLVKSTAPSILPAFVVRSDEVLGRSAESAIPKDNFKLTLLTALSAALSVLGMAIFGLRKVEKVVMPSKRTAIMYITLSCQNESLTAAVQNEGEKISYMQLADMLVAYGRVSENTKKRAISGLMCLHAIERMAEVSRSVVTRNLKTLLDSAETAEVKAPSQRFLLNDSDILKFREYVDETFGIKTARALGDKDAS